MNITLPAKTWININDASGISVGKRILIENLTPSSVRIVFKDTQPTSADSFSNIEYGKCFDTEKQSELSIWAYDFVGGGIDVKLYDGVASMENSDGEQIPAAAVQFLDNIAFVDHFGQSIVGQLESYISVNFGYGVINTDYDVKTPITVGDGQVVATNGYLEVSSTTGSANVESRDDLKYSNGRGFITTFTSSFEGTGEGYAGGFDGDTLHDGFPIYRNGTTDQLQFGYLKEGVFTSPVDIPYAALGIDITKVNIWAVIGGYLGVANPTLLVKMDTWKVAAVIRTEGRLDGTHVRLPAFPIAIRTEGDMTIKSGSWHGCTVGEAKGVQDRGFSYPNQIFSLAGGENPVTAPRGRLTITNSTSVNTAFVIHSKVLFNGLPNKIRADVVNIEIKVVSSNGSGVLQGQLIGNATGLNPAPVYSDISSSSVLEVDDNAGGQSTGRFVAGTSDGFLVGEPINVAYAANQGNNPGTVGVQSTLIEELQLDGIADETLTLILRDTSGASTIDVYWYVTWIERQI